MLAATKVHSFVFRGWLGSISSQTRKASDQPKLQGAKTPKGDTIVALTARAPSSLRVIPTVTSNRYNSTLAVSTLAVCLFLDTQRFHRHNLQTHQGRKPTIVKRTVSINILKRDWKFMCMQRRLLLTFAYNLNTILIVY